MSDKIVHEISIVISAGRLTKEESQRIKESLPAHLINTLGRSISVIYTKVDSRSASEFGIK